jgi:hypothetical protein
VEKGKDFTQLPTAAGSPVLQMEGQKHFGKGLAGLFEKFGVDGGEYRVVSVFLNRCPWVCRQVAVCTGVGMCLYLLRSGRKQIGVLWLVTQPTVAGTAAGCH